MKPVNNFNIRKDMGVNEHEKLSNITYKVTALFAVLHLTCERRVWRCQKGQSEFVYRNQGQGQNLQFVEDGQDWV